jgi:hypothetical protein
MFQRFNQDSRFPYLILILLWVISIIIVNPLREFPLNDDWVYAWSVMQLTENAKFIIHDWVGFNLLTHILWGSIFTDVFGFSFSILRISTLIMSLAGVLVGYKLIGDLLKDKNKALLLSLLIAFNPLFFNLSFTFMTDLTFYGMVVLSGYFYIRSFRNDDRCSIYFATVFAVIAVLTRQVGLFVPLSATITVAFIQWRVLNRKVFVYTLHTLFVVLVMVGYTTWLNATGNKPEAFREVSHYIQPIGIVLQRLVDYTGRWLAETGLWFLPLAIFFTIRSWNSYKRYLLPAGLITMVLGVGIVVQTSHFPGGNIFYVLGLGPHTLADAYIFGISETEAFVNPMIIILRALALIGGFLLAWLMITGAFDVFSRIRKEPDLLTMVKLFSITLIIIYQAVFLGSFTYFDRYGIILFVPVLILIYPAGLIGKKPTRTASSMLIAYILLIAVFSIIATRDYLGWNQLRWDMANELVEKGTDPQDIDGGHEYNGWHGTEFDKYGRWDPGKFEYVLSFTVVEGYEVVDAKSYFRMIPLSENYIYVLKKSAEQTPPENTGVIPN